MCLAPLNLTCVAHGFAWASSLHAHDCTVLGELVFWELLCIMIIAFWSNFLFSFISILCQACQCALFFICICGSVWSHMWSHSWLSQSTSLRMHSHNFIYLHAVWGYNCERCFMFLCHNCPSFLGCMSAFFMTSFGLIAYAIVHVRFASVLWSLWFDCLVCFLY
jgi:hypothetical protein